MRSRLQGQLHQGIAWGKHFFLEELWDLELPTLTRARAFLLHWLRIGAIALRRFSIDQCLLRASGLTYTTLLSLVPLLAILFSIFKGLKIHQTLKIYDILRQKLPEQMVNSMGGLIDQLFSYIDRMDVGYLGLSSVILLLVTVVMVIGNIESAFNQIWGIRTSRTISRKVSDYISVLLIAPIFVAVALAVTVSLESNTLTQRLGLAGFVRGLVGAMPFLFALVAFVSIFMLVPNTRVKLGPALAGGIVAAILWQLLQTGFVSFQHVSMRKFETVYGGFAQLIIFLFWVYWSWAIVLFGAELSFACQNVDIVGGEHRVPEARFAYREALALRMAREVARSFETGAERWSAERFSREWNVPVRLAKELLGRLVSAGVLAQVGGAVAPYQPARDPRGIRVRAVLDAVRGRIDEGPRLRGAGAGPAVKGLVGRVEAAVDRELGELSLYDLATGEQGKSSETV